MPAKPFILISGSTTAHGVEFSDTSLSLSVNYALAIKASAGAPWLLPCIPERDFVSESVRRCDGVMLTGGDDVHPGFYTTRLPLRLRRTVRTASPDRDLFEVMLIAEVFRQRKPLLAICRGQQILNVALGGSLFVDIRSQVVGALNHQRTDRRDQIVHEVTAASGSILAKIAGKHRLGVNSSHHQAVGKIAKPLCVTAVSIDGVVEGLELRPAERNLLPYLLAVQFHPERLFARHAEHLELFKSFISACRPTRRKKV